MIARHDARRLRMPRRRLLGGSRAPLRRDQERRERPSDILSCFESFDHIVLCGTRGGRDLLDSWRTTLLLRQSAYDLTNVEVELLDAPRGPNGPSAVSKVTLELPDDRPGREGREFHSTLGIEAVDRLDERERAHLDEVVIRLAPVDEPSRQVLCEPEVRLYEPAARIAVSGGGI